MKMRVLLTLVGLAVGFAVPALTQEKGTVDPQLRQQIEALIIKFDDAYYKNDAAGIADLFARDAVEVWGWDKFSKVASGQQAIERSIESTFQSPGICRPSFFRRMLLATKYARSRNSTM
jgi:hypothetical protein